MAIRTTPGEVQEIMSPGGDYKPGKPVDPFIRMASRMVDAVQAAAPDYDLTPMDETPSTIEAPSTARLVETWLAAWAYKMSDRQLASSGRGRASAPYTNQNGKGLEANSYGQTAMLLDTTGLLGASNSGRVVGTAWLGKFTDEMLTWDERNRATM